MSAAILDPPSWILVLFQLKIFGFFNLKKSIFSIIEFWSITTRLNF